MGQVFAMVGEGGRWTIGRGTMRRWKLRWVLTCVFWSIRPDCSIQVKIALGMLDQASHEVSRPSTSNEADSQTAICAESSPWLCPWRARR